MTHYYKNVFCLTFAFAVNFLI